LEVEESADESSSFIPHYLQMLIELVHIRRRKLNYLSHKGEFSLELILESEWEFDVEEKRLKKKDLFFHQLYRSFRQG
jgi:hypothetical protein